MKRLGDTAGSQTYAAQYPFSKSKAKAIVWRASAGLAVITLAVTWLLWLSLVRWQSGQPIGWATYLLIIPVAYCAIMLWRGWFPIKLMMTPNPVALSISGESIIYLDRRYRSIEIGKIRSVECLAWANRKYRGYKLLVQTEGSSKIIGSHYLVCAEDVLDAKTVIDGLIAEGGFQ